jgi:hypothetical protein
MSVEGTWSVKIQAPDGEVAGTLQLSGEARLTGTMAASVGSIDVTGSQDGNAIELSGELDAPTGKIELTFTGTVRGDEIAGEVRFGPYANGPWSAQRT